MIRIVISLEKVPVDFAPDAWLCECPMFDIKKEGSTPRVAFMNTVNALKRVKKEQLEGLL